MSYQEAYSFVSQEGIVLFYDCPCVEEGRDYDERKRKIGKVVKPLIGCPHDCVLEGLSLMYLNLVNRGCL